MRVGVLEAQVKTSMTLERKFQNDGVAKTYWFERRVPWKNEAATRKLSQGFSQLRRDVKHLGAENVELNPRLAAFVPLKKEFMEVGLDVEDAVKL